MATIDIGKFRGIRSTTFTGRPQGKIARKELDLDSLDQGTDLIEIEIPEGTTSFNPSFFLGLFYESIKKLTLEKFNEKYKIIIRDQDQETVRVLKRNIEDGIRNAMNELNKKVGFSSFLN
jgi:hypothetical protein